MSHNTSVPPLHFTGEFLDYNPPLSLWKLIEEHVHVHEQEEIKRILGKSLVDQSLELHEEVDTLLSIWQDYREENYEHKANTPSLPEPPEQRERLVQEICFFVENVREKAKDKGIDPSKLLSRHNNSVIDYALESSRQSSGRSSASRPMSGGSRGTPRIMSPCRVSIDEGISEEMQSMSNKLNYLQLDDVVGRLRHTLEEEISCLLKDITFLQECLDDEVSARTEDSTGLTREPTLTELKEERSALEKELLAQEKLPVTPPSKKLPFEPPQTPPRLHPVSKNSVLRRPGSCGVTQTGQPLKALHDGPAVQSSHTSSVLSMSHNPRLQHRSPPTPEGSTRQTPSPVSLKDVAMVEKSSQRRTLSPSRVKVVPVGSIKSSSAHNSPDSVLVPSPPKTKPVRPSSADRFRKLVLNCRDTS